MMVQNLDSSYKKLTRPKVTLNGVEYEVRNLWSEEEIADADFLCLRDAEGYEKFHKTAKGIAKDYENALRSTGLHRYLDAHTLEKYTTENQWQKLVKTKAIEFIEKQNGWFFISGQSGSGKTHICNAIAISLMRKGKTMKHMLWFDEVNYLKYNMDSNKKDIYKYTITDVLYIDDFLKTRNDTNPTDIEIELAYQIIDARYRKNKITILSTEKTLAQIKSYDEAVHGRLVEMSKKYLIQIQKDDSKNYRLRGRHDK